MKQQNPAISKGIDWSLIWIYLLLVSIGLTAIFAATYKEGDAIIQSFIGFKTDYSKQFYFFIIGAVLAFFILLTDSKFFSATANLWYVVGIFLLLLVFPFHSNIKGTESIIRMGAFNFQPAEFCKIFVSLGISKIFIKTGNRLFKDPFTNDCYSHCIISGSINHSAKRNGSGIGVFFFFYCNVQRRIAVCYFINRVCCGNISRCDYYH